MAKIFLRKRWGVLLGLLLGLPCGSILFAQVFESKDIAAVFDQEAYNEYKAREFASLDDLISQYESDLLYWMPIALPDTERDWWKQSSWRLWPAPFDPAGFPSDFLKGLVPVTKEGVTIYPVSIVENYYTRNREIFSANGSLIASVPPPNGYTSRWFVYHNYPGLDSWGLSESRFDEMIGIYDCARLTVQMDIILDDDLINLLMRRSVLAAVAAQAQQKSAAASGMLARAKPDGGATTMRRSLDADHGLSIDSVTLGPTGLTLQISYPNSFTNRISVFASTDLVAKTWFVAATNLSTQGTNSITWTAGLSGTFRSFRAANQDKHSDADGLSDAEELFLFGGLDANSVDTDGDGLADGFSGTLRTNDYPGGVSLDGVYVVGEQSVGTSARLFDTDDDGMGDGWEVAHGHNPLDGNDPPNVRGTIGYSGGQTGPVLVLAVETADSWATNHAVRLNAPGAYRIPNLTATNYWIKAFRDSNSDASNDLAEAWGYYSTNAITITNKVLGINFSLADPDVNTNNIPDFWEIANFGSLTNSSAGADPDGDEYTNLEEYQARTDPNDIASHPWNVSGVIAYAGPQTGTIWVIASTNASSWTGARSNSIAQPGAYTLTHLPPNKNYWIWAWRDTDGDTNAAYWEAYGDAAQNPVYLSGNCTNIDLTLADPDSDGDDLPDWWCVQYGLDSFDGTRSDAAGWWKLDEATGTNVLDSSGNANHGALWNAPTNAWTFGVISNALTLDGTNCYVQLADTASLKPEFVSVALWLKPDRDYTNGSAAFFSKRTSGGTAGYSLGYENGKLTFTICSSGAKTVQLPCALTNGVWRHVVGAYGGENQRLYVDGALVAETNYNWGAGFGEIAQDTTNPRLGATADASPTNHFAGALDDVLVFGQELSSNRVVGLYQLGADFDGDGLSNWREFQIGACPTNFDTDGDGMPDGWEVACGHNPLDVNDPPNVRGQFAYLGGQTGPVIVVAVDTADSWATNHAVRLTTPGPYRISNLTATNYWIKAFIDSDGDACNGLTEAWGAYSVNAIEITNMVDNVDFFLTDPDSDDDGLPDWWEIKYGLAPNDAQGENGASGDPDGDQFTNIQEYENGTDPKTSDIVRASLPYQTGFEPSPTEAYTLGDLAGQEDWLATTGLVTVQNEVVDSGTQAARLNASGAKASHFFNAHYDAVETVLHVKLSSSAIFPPAVLPAGVAFLVSFDPTRGVMAFDGDGNDGGSWAVVPDSLLPDQWIEMRIIQNHSLPGSPPHTWGVFVTGHGSMTNLGFKADSVSSLNGTHIMSGPTDTNYLDNITIQEATSVPW